MARYIDAESLRMFVEVEENGTISMEAVNKAFEKMLETAPTADVQEVIHRMTPMRPNKTSELMGDLSKYGIGYCPHCGTGVNDEMKYCSNCGQRLGWSDEE